MPKPLDPLLAEAIKLHDAGADGDKEAVKAAHELLSKLHSLHPNEPVIQAYYGSSTVLLGRDAIDPIERFNKAAKGLKALDCAVANAPENITIRLLRAYVSYNLPEEFFHRTKTAVEDFLFLKQAYEKDNSSLPQKTYWQLLYNLGDAYQRLGDSTAAQNVWSELLENTTDPQFKKLLQLKR